MTTRARITTFGSAGLLVVAGVACALLVGGSAGPILAFILVGLGLVLATSLLFLEVGLSEDRDREQERKAASRRIPRPRPRPLARRRPTIERSRGHRRRLR